MNKRSGKLVLGAAWVLASLPAWAQTAHPNPYVLTIDRAPYLLSIAGTNAAPSAAAGASAAPPAVPQRPAQTSADRLAQEAAARRERDYEYRISQLAVERDTWRRRALELEAEMRAMPGSRVDALRLTPAPR